MNRSYSTPAQDEKSFRLIRDGIVVFDQTRKAVFVDESVYGMLGLSGPPASRESVLDRVQISGAIPLEDVVREAFEEGEWRGEAAGLTADDHAIYLEVMIRRLHGEHPDGSGAIMFLRNVTRDRVMENRVLEAQQMELVDKLSRGVAHELKNITTIILAYASLLEMRLEDEEMLDAVQKISETASRTTEVTRRLTSLTRRPQPEFENADLGDIMEQVKALVAKTLPSHASLDLPDQEGLPMVFVDPGAIIRCIIHVALNACEAMPDGGVLTMDVDMIEVEPQDIKENHPVQEPGHFAVISITDTGLGMPEDVMARLFEPFFTTKEKGSGLGLYSVKTVLSTMNGWIGIYSEPGQGTCVKLYLPVVGQGEALPGANANGFADELKSETVLVIDDDGSIAQTARVMLERAGYRVLTAPGGKEALFLVKKEPASVDVVLCDVVMPELNGDELVQCFHDIRSDLPVVLTSGFPRPRVEKIIGRASYPFIAKPYTQKSLIGGIRHALIGVGCI
jgi:hypothetical protein